MKVLITGAGGMLGTDLAKALSPFSDVTGAGITPAPHLQISYDQTDLSDRSATKDLISSQKPGLIFHAAAMTNVDACESARDLAIQGNVDVTRHVVDSANEAGAFVVFFSTDYIFNGEKNGEYLENDPPCPLNVYGDSKVLAEKYVRENASDYWIVRLTWLYGFHGKSFPRTILERAPRQKKFEVVNDQVGRPSYTKDVAEAFAGLFKKNPAGFKPWNREIFHFANQGTVSWADFARTVLKLAGEESEVVPISSFQLDRPARRPHNSVLSLTKAREKLGIEFRPWQEALADFLKEFRMQEYSR